MLTDRRGNALLVTVVAMGAVVALASVMGFLLVQGGPADAATATEPRDVDVVAEQWNDQLFLVVTGGGDLANVTDFAVSGASLSGSLDPGADQPRVRGTVDLPTTVTVTATFEDGSSQVVAEWQFE